MKADLISKKGESKGKIDLPKSLDLEVRPDIVKKLLEFEKSVYMQAYGTTEDAGMKRSASGKMRHQRHRWGSHYGRGISRIPRKVMWRRGTQFFWVGAIVSGTKGGRRPHGPKVLETKKKINKKEIKIAFNSALAATFDEKLILERYSTLKQAKGIPFVIEELPTKTKDLSLILKKIFPSFNLLKKNKEVRAGKGKSRGRKYKSNAGLLILISPEEKFKSKVFDVRSIDEVSMKDLYPLGRLCIFTKKSLEYLNKEEKK